MAIPNGSISVSQPTATLPVTGVTISWTSQNGNGSVYVEQNGVMIYGPNDISGTNEPVIITELGLTTFNLFVDGTNEDNQGSPMRATILVSEATWNEYMIFEIKTDLPKQTQAEIDRIQAIPVGLRTTTDANFLTNLAPYLTNVIFLQDSAGLILHAEGNSLPTGYPGFKKGALYRLLTRSGRNLYENVSDNTSSATWSLLTVDGAVASSSPSMSASVSPSVSPSTSVSASTSASVSPSPSSSASASASASPSGSASASPSTSRSLSPSTSISPSGSQSPSGSASSSSSASLSPSTSVSASVSISPSGSSSRSTSPSASISLSPSASLSPSGSASPSGSTSASISGSRSTSPSASLSPSTSPSASPS